MTTKLEFLAQHPLFRDLYDDDLEELAAIVEEYEYQDGKAVAYQRDVAEALYLVKSGRLYAKTVERGIVTQSRDYLPGDTFGGRWLFSPGVHPATIQAASRNGRPARVLVLHSRDFLRFLSQNQHAIDALEPVYDQTEELIAGFPDDLYQEALKIRAKRDRRSSTMNILPDEFIEYISRRSGWYLLLRLLPPLLGFLLVPLIPLALLSSILSANTFLYNLQFYCPGLVALAFFLWGVFRFWDWTNDYFIITNRRVIHREFNLRQFRIDIKIARIDQVQSVQVEKPTLLTNLLKYGTTRITTASQYGVIFFDKINRPGRVAEILNRLTKQVKTLDASREQTMVRQSIEDYFQVDRAYERIEEGAEETAVADEGAYPSLWGRFYNRFYWRVEEANIIIYRKHFLVVLGALLWPLLIAGVIALLTYLLLLSALLPGQILLPFIGVIYFFIFLWIVWRVEDWRNDIFMLTDRLIIDIDRTPFGFGESRKQAALENIQNVKAYTPGLIHTIFNYGFVETETAGVDSNIMFENVPFPGVIQSDIFQRIEDFKRRQREEEEARRHKSFAVLLDVYKQEEEQRRLPRRTPYPLTAEELEGEED